MTWMNTYTGKRFDLLDPRPENVGLLDIAHALSNQARYAGHTVRHYSVAEHSLIVFDAVRTLAPEDIDLQRWALMHDAAEAYVTDIPWPLIAAGLAGEIKAAEKRIMAVICERFSLSAQEPAFVKEIDLELLDLEADALLVRHEAWPRGTPREPRAETRAAFARWMGEHRVKDWFIASAAALGLA